MSQKWNVEFFNIRRNGTNSQHGLQRISSMIAQKHDKTLQQDPRLDQLQTELLTLPQRSKIQHSPPYNIYMVAANASLPNSSMLDLSHALEFSSCSNGVTLGQHVKNLALL